MISGWMKNQKQVQTLALAVVFVVLQMTTAAHAGPACPLSNPKYKTLSEAVAALSGKIKLPAHCAAKEAALQEAVDALGTSADKLKEIGGTEFQEDLAKGKESTLQAISSLNTINSVLLDDCARSLMTTGDFVNAFIDSVNAITPFVLIFGGESAAPWALGTMVTGSAIKTIIGYFGNNGIDMNKDDQRRALVENSCSYYTLNETVRSLIQAQQSEETDIQKALVRAEEELKQLEHSEPTKPNGDLISADTAAKEDLKRLSSIRLSIETAKDSGFSCFLAKKKIREGEFNSAGGRLLKILNKDASEAAVNDRALVEYFESNLHRHTQYDQKKPADCAAKAVLWMNSLEAILTKTTTRIEPRVKDDSLLIVHRKWQEQLTKKKTELQDYRLRQKFLTELLGSGAVVETSEILATLTEIRDILFGNRGWGRKGPAHSWVSYKVRLSDSRLKSFSNKHEALFKAAKHAKESQKKDLCSRAEQTRNTWYAAAVHARAAREFCMAFDSTINQQDFKRLQKACFSSAESAVPAQIRRVSDLQSSADQVSALMNKLECKKPGALALVF